MDTTRRLQLSHIAEADRRRGRPARGDEHVRLSPSEMDERVVERVVEHVAERVAEMAERVAERGVVGAWLWGYWACGLVSVAVVRGARLVRPWA